MDSFHDEQEVMVVDEDNTMPGSRHENIMSRCNKKNQDPTQVSPGQRPRLLYNSELSDCYPGEYPRGLLGQNSVVLVESEPPYKPNTYRNQHSEFAYFSTTDSQHDQSGMSDMTPRGPQYIDITSPSHPMDSYSFNPAGVQIQSTRGRKSSTQNPGFTHAQGRQQSPTILSDFKPIRLEIGSQLDFKTVNSQNQRAGDPFSSGNSSFRPQPSTQAFRPLESLEKQTSGAFSTPLDKYPSNGRFQTKAIEFGGNFDPNQGQDGGNFASNQQSRDGRQFGPNQQIRDGGKFAPNNKTSTGKRVSFQTRKIPRNAHKFSTQIEDDNPFDGLNRQNDEYFSNNTTRDNNFALNDGQKRINFASNNETRDNFALKGTTEPNFAFNNGNRDNFALKGTTEPNFAFNNGN
ncbi:hypothetical protein WDU94_005872 [Cyamophila willieti]